MFCKNHKKSDFNRFLACFGKTVSTVYASDCFPLRIIQIKSCRIGKKKKQQHISLVEPNVFSNEEANLHVSAKVKITSEYVNVIFTQVLWEVPRLSWRQVS